MRRCVRLPHIVDPDGITGPRPNPETHCGKRLGREIKMIDTWAAVDPTTGKQDPRYARAKAGLLVDIPPEHWEQAGDRYAEPPSHEAPHRGLDEALSTGEKVCPVCLVKISALLG